MTYEELKAKMDESHYIYDETLATVLFVALQLGRPLLIEGAAGVGKTEVAKVMAAALDRELVRLQGSVRVELSEAAAFHPGEYERPGSGQPDKEPVQRRIPAGAAAAPVHPVGEAGGAAHRRD